MSMGDQDYRSGMAGFDAAVRQHEAYHKPTGSGERAAQADRWAREAVESARPIKSREQQSWEDSKFLVTGKVVCPRSTPLAGEIGN